VAEKGKARWLRVRVYDKTSEKLKVKVNIPLALVKIGARIGAKFDIRLPDEARRQMAEKGIDPGNLTDVKKLEAIIDNLASQGSFRLVDVEEDDEKVEVFID